MATAATIHDTPQAGQGGRPFAYVEIFRSAPTDRIRIIKAGVPANKAKQMITDLHFDQQVLLEALNLKTATVNRKAARGEALSIEDGERVIGMARLVGQVEAMVEESGDPAGFDATLWLSQWLCQPVAALGHVRPIELLDTMEGQKLVADTLARAQSGAYA